MQPNRWQAAKKIFEHALDLDPGALHAYLDEACANDPELRMELQSLLAAHRAAGNFIQTPVKLDGILFAEGESSDPLIMVGRMIGHYEIRSLVGAGGMGEVYSAMDSRLGRSVAIKLLSRQFAREPQALERFQREARAASALNHPNICTLHDIGEHQGQPFLVMELLEGQSLKERLATASLPIGDILTWACQIADALEAAHAKGIVHRDIKPTNIFITRRGPAKILDFGVAKLLSRPAQAHEGDVSTATTAPAKANDTIPGTVMGTIPYMSPEQAQGKDVDARSDIFSFGSVLYEMVSGRLPFAPETNSDELVAILEREPEPLVRHRPEVPAELERVVRRCLEKDRERRYQSARDLLTDLSNLKLHPLKLAAASGRHKIWHAAWVSQRMFFASVVLMLALASFFYLLKFRSIPSGIPSFTKSLAVLPLENLSGDSQQDFLSDGMTDGLIASLAQISTLRVISRTSVMQYKGSRRPLREIAKELNVGAVLEGTVLSSGHRVRITVHLIEADTDRHLWVKNYEGDLSDILKFQSEMARAAAQEIQVMMTSSEKARLAKFRPVKREAYEAYLRGVVEGNKEYLEKAIALDPDFAPAYSGLARLYNFDAWGGATAPSVALPKVRDLAQTALQKDDALAEAHVWLAGVYLYYDWNWKEAEKEFRIALELNPGSGEVRDYYAHLLLARNRTEESVAESKRALELNPLDVILRSCVAWHSFYSRQYDEMIDYGLKALAMDTNNGPALWLMGLAYEQKSMFKEAIAAFTKSQRLSDVGRALAISGNSQSAREVLAEYEKRKQRYRSAYSIALIHHFLGDNERAFEWLETAYRERDFNLIHLNTDPRLDSLRSDPRFQDLMRRVKLPA